MQRFIVTFLLSTLLGSCTAQFPNFSPLFGSSGDSTNLFTSPTPSGSPGFSFNNIGDFQFPSQFGGSFGFDSDPSSSPPVNDLFGNQGFTGVPILNSFIGASPSTGFNSLGDFAQNLQNTSPDQVLEVLGSVTFADVDCDVGTSPGFSQKFREEVGKEAGCSDGSCVDIIDLQCGSLVITYKITLDIAALGISVTLENTGPINEFIRDAVVFIAASRVLNFFGIETTVTVEIQSVEFTDPSPPTPTPPPYGGRKGMILDSSDEEEIVSTFAYLDALMSDN
eukprot:TRINITY_DN996_c0_g2_i3.p2 TRINITY_DN996_c0_g2~~TRINITY_DN996_c0_g2_i3.p2  ORF type:complete len:304 (-),score=49.29 TRINITY_DN996_c0_g2_i3:1383-2222(-)